MSAVSGHASFNDGTVYNSYHQAGTAQSFREILVLIILITVAAGGVIIPACLAPASLIRPTPKKTPIA